ncbi:hypothetical protein [Couchioplanes azureus]|uniref:hypothetical protein n=1 Tax=Couchioplanes caeruleus TaxID=56438 RepID=UPI0019AD643B|nr:hypothetical protein [Couchioplanes caeruleus]GGQ66005.1 hypothetical protein GCM10010166_39570 [Couchioplanes caeruleus subsp. azureus]
MVAVVGAALVGADGDEVTPGEGAALAWLFALATALAGAVPSVAAATPVTPTPATRAAATA